MDMVASLLLAIALMLIIEGMFPFVFPNYWRDTFRRISQRPPHQIRIGGLIAMVLGVILLIIAT
ncbi:MAG: Putative inner membrane protein YjeT (clustered with HflC) [uncultured Caballeronia sp.]|nr:MAG: Putative inner membrane protein YjeT (clustered with HflC) [uncultured Caballeronia sp.]